MTQSNYSDKHLDEARNLKVFGGEAQIELQLGHVCNNRCVFCVSGQLTEERVAKQIPADPVFDALKRGRDQGCHRVTFLGGEPTVQKSFMPALTLAVELGYKEIVIFTNGVKTRKPEFVDKIMALGGNYEWRFSVQGGTKEAHDAVTKRQGSFTRITQGMRYVKSLGEDVTINMCINRLSYESVANFPELCDEYGVRQLHIDQIRPSDSGTRDMGYFESIMPRYSEMAPYFEQMLDKFEVVDPDYDVNLGNYPYCQLPQYAHKIHHDGQKTFTYPANPEGLLPAFDKYPQKRSDKFHPPQCGKCAFVKHCNGVFETYAELYGTDEFKPVTLEKLQSIDKNMNFFVQLIEPHLAPLLSTQPPAPWRAVERFSNTRDRIIELRFVDGNGHAATVIVTPPAGVGKHIAVHPPLLETDRCRISLLADDDSDVEALTELLSWVESGLLETDTIQVVRGLDRERLAAGFFTPARLAKGLRRLSRLVTSLRSSSFGAECKVTGVNPLSVGIGRALSIEGPDGTALTLTLTLQADEARPLVAVGYHLPNEIEPEVARPMLQAVMATLRG